MKKRALLLSLLSLPFATRLSGALAAEPWPSRPIRFVVPTSAGTGSDLFCRQLAERLGTALKQPVIVDNKPGANGLIATKTVQSAPADGYTFLYSTASATVMLAALKPDLGIDFTKDVVPVAATAIGGVLLLVNPQFPAKDLKELVAVVKANPGKYTYASWGIGSNGHLTMEWLKKQAGMQIDHVPYKGVPPLLAELSSGIVPIGWTDPISSMSFIKSGKVRAIAVNGTVRTPQLTSLPTMGEQGYPFPALGWHGIFAPPNTPPAILQRLHAEMNRILASDDVKAMATRMNTEPPPVWPAERFKAMIETDLAEWKKIVRDANVTID